MHIDLIVLSAGGSLVDALSIAIRSILRDLAIPFVEIIEGQEEGEEDRIVHIKSRIIIQIQILCTEQNKFQYNLVKQIQKLFLLCFVK